MGAKNCKVRIDKIIKEIADQEQRIYVKRWIRSVVEFPLLACIVSIAIQAIVEGKFDIWFMLSNLIMLGANILLNTYALSDDIQKSENMELREDTKFYTLCGMFVCWIVYSFTSGYTMNWRQGKAGDIVTGVLVIIIIGLFICTYKAILTGIKIRIKEFVGNDE